MERSPRFRAQVCKNWAPVALSVSAISLPIPANLTTVSTARAGIYPGAGPGSAVVDCSHAATLIGRSAIACDLKPHSLGVGGNLHVTDLKGG